MGGLSVLTACSPPPSENKCIKPSREVATLMQNFLSYLLSDSLGNVISKQYICCYSATSISLY